LVARELSAEHPAMQLTERQRDVLALAAMGSRNDQIALELCITTGTVKRHLHDAFAALGASSRVEAVGRARSFGLI
jgi:DNA-binding NarL/FixJ family response regulator